MRSCHFVEGLSCGPMTVIMPNLPQLSSSIFLKLDNYRYATEATNLRKNRVSYLGHTELLRPSNSGDHRTSRELEKGGAVQYTGYCRAIKYAGTRDDLKVCSSYCNHSNIDKSAFDSMSTNKKMTEAKANQPTKSVSEGSWVLSSFSEPRCDRGMFFNIYSFAIFPFLPLIYALTKK